MKSEVLAAEGQIRLCSEGLMLKSVNQAPIMFEGELLFLQGIQVHHGIVREHLIEKNPSTDWADCKKEFLLCFSSRSTALETKPYQSGKSWAAAGATSKQVQFEPLRSQMNI